MDALAEVLRAIKIDAAIYLNGEFSEPWCVLTPEAASLFGRDGAHVIIYHQFFWGFFSVALAWQIAFLLIGSNPVRFRPLMVPAIVEKFGLIVTLALLLGRGRILSADAAAAIPDTVVGLLFVAAFAGTSSEPVQHCRPATASPLVASA